MSQLVLQQSINEPTYILGNFSFFIDLIFTSHLFLLIEYVLHPSLYSNYHHQITYVKFNLKIHCLCPYEREIENYQTVNTNYIRKDVEKSKH